MERESRSRGGQLNLLWVSSLLLVAYLGVTACGSAEKPHVVDISRPNSFVPATLIVSPGEIVVWKNRDHEVHSTDFAPSLALHLEEASVQGDIAGWASGDITSGETYTLRFNEPGIYPYRCRYHAGMIGAIVVTATE